MSQFFTRSYSYIDLHGNNNYTSYKRAKGRKNIDLKVKDREDLFLKKK